MEAGRFRGRIDDPPSFPDGGYASIIRLHAPVPLRSQRGLDVRPVEVATLEEQRLGTDLGEGIDRTIDDIQLRRMSLPLAEAAKCMESGRGHFVIQWHHDNSAVLQQFFDDLVPRNDWVPAENLRPFLTAVRKCLQTTRESWTPLHSGANVCAPKDSITVRRSRR